MKIKINHNKDKDVKVERGLNKIISTILKIMELNSEDLQNNDYIEIDFINKNNSKDNLKE